MGISPRLDDERGIIVSWLVKIVIGIAVAGVILYDAGSIASNFFRLDSSADDMAVELSDYAGTGTPANRVAVERQAKFLAHEIGAKLVSVEIDTQARLVKVKIRRKASTVIVNRIGAIEDWAKATADGQAGYN